MGVCASIDSNILIYAALEPNSDKGRCAAATTLLATPSGVLALQALLEFVAVVRRRSPSLTQQAIDQVDAWSAAFITAPTTLAVSRAANRLVQEHKFQVWDAVIWSAARMAGATVFLSDDLQDGLQLDGMRVVNPFKLTPEDLKSLLD